MHKCDLQVVSNCQDYRGGINIMLTGHCYVLCTLPVLLVMWITACMNKQAMRDIIQLYTLMQ